MSNEKRLSSLLSDFARTMVTNFPIQAILDHLVVRIVQVLPVGSAGVSLVSPEHIPRHVAASDAAALRFIRIQEQMGKGPCITAHETGVAVAIPDLLTDTRFPEFSRRGTEEGLRAVFSFPLRHEDHRLGALDLYRTTQGPMDADDMEVSQTLADVATAYILNAQGRVDLEASAKLAQHNSLHDALTGLPNRGLFVQRLDHAMLRCRRSGKMLAVLYADLDHFKSVNDTFGHHLGDDLLVAVADRLTGILRPGDTLARLAGDEFAVLCEDLDEEAQAESLASRIGAVMMEPFTIGGSELAVTASVGIAFAGLADDVPEAILQKADAAMYQAKRTGGAHHAIIDLRDHQLSTHLSRLNRDLRGALRREELSLHYQPIVDTGTGRFDGSEALLRWSHPSYGAVTPGTFIPLAEQSGMIAEIGDWVLGQATSNLGRWPGDNLEKESGISVNVSVNQLMAPNFAGSVEALLARAGVNPGLLTLEVTENVLVADEDRALSVLTALKRIGVMLALDDFGSGQSSLNHIKWFPIDVVKIDKEFISDIGENQASRLIVDAVVGLAHGLGMTVVAEGVETRGQLREVADLGCDFSQGYLFARPEPADTLDILLSGHHTLPWSRPPELALGPSREATLGPDLARADTISYLPPLEKWRRKQA